MTSQEENLIYWIENYQDRQKEISKKLNKLKALIKKGKSNTEEAASLKEDIYYMDKIQEVPMGELSVGTDFYDGVGLFFAGEYKYPLRENTTKSQLKRVHKAFLKAGVDLNGVSPEHEEIIKRIVG